LDGTRLSKDEYASAMKWFYYSIPNAKVSEFAENFFSVIEDIFSTKHRDYAEVFMTTLCPVKFGRKEDKKNLEKIYASVDEERTHFRKLLKIAIEDLEDIISKRK
jgi:hypothetical protein